MKNLLTGFIRGEPTPADQQYRQHKPAGANPDSFVFEKEGEPMDDRSILRNVIRPAAKRLGFCFEGFGWHSFRRQNITVLQEERATAFEAMAQAGHSRPSMTGEYTIVGLGRREQAVRRYTSRARRNWLSVRQH